MRIAQIIFIALAISPSVINAQIQVRGIVIDEEKKPLPFVTIAFESVKGIEGTFSNVDGKFQISLPAESYSITIQMVGFGTKKLENISIHESIDLGSFQLVSEIRELDEVVVRAERSYIESDLGKKTLHVGADLTNAGATAVEALEALPSVTTTVDGNINVRGSENVIIYVNGKETKRSPKTLRFISADALQKIELITNPSAKYDAEGVAGIINLIYAKTKSTKLEAFVSGSVPVRGSIGINSSVSSSKFTLFANLSERRSRFETSDDQTRISSGDSLRSFENLAFSIGNGLTREINSGVTFEPDTNFSLGLEVNYLRWHDTAEQTQLGIFNYLNADNSIIELANDWLEIEDEVSLTLTSEKRFQGNQSLKLQFTAGGENETNETNFNKTNTEISGTPFQESVQLSDETEDQRYYQTKLDYSKQLQKDVTLEVGIVTDAFDININQKLDFFDDGALDNRFGIKMDKYGGYCLIENKKNRFEYAVGLRYEQFTSVSLNKETDSTFTQRFENFFPSVQWKYRLGKGGHDLGFSFTRRINRPTFWEVSPFVSYTDPLNLETGNPYLRPEFAYLYELTYSGTLDKFSYDLTGFRRSTVDIIQRTTTSLNDEQILISYANFGTRHDDGVELNATYDVSEKVVLAYSASAYRTMFGNTNQNIFFQKRWNWQMRTKLQFRLDNGWGIDLVQYYRAPRYDVQSVSIAQHYLNASVQKTFAKKRGSVTLSLRDAFNTRLFGSKIAGEGFDINNRYKFQTRVLSLALRYKILE